MSISTRAWLMGGVALTGVLGNPAMAQTAPVANNLGGTASDADIVVTGVRKSLEGALDIKRSTNQFVDALVAEDFAQFPDTNLAEALQRIPGITVDRSEGADQSNAVGEGGTINLRGLGPDFTRTEINGVTAPVAGPGRGFGFNVLASELFVRATVSKSLSASQNEGGLAGTVDLRTYRPFDFDKRLLSVSARGSYATLANAVTPAGTLIFADRFAGGRLGVAIGVNFDRTEPRDLSVDALNWDFLRDQYGANFAALPAAVRTQLTGVQYPRGPRIIENDRRQNRLNATLSLQAQPSDNLTLTLDNIYAKVDHTGVQNRQGLSVLNLFTGAPRDVVIEGDRLLSGTFTTGNPVSSLINYDYDVQTTIYQGIAAADWKVADNFTVTPRLGYSYAREQYRKWDQITLLSRAAETVIGSAGDFTFFSTAAGNQTDPAIYNRLFEVRNRPDNDQEQEYSARLDFVWTFGDSPLQSIEFGGRWAKQTKNFDAFDGRATITTPLTNFTPFITARPFDFGGTPTGFPTQILGIDFNGLRTATGTASTVAARLDESSYEVTEETLAGYLVSRFKLGRLTGDAGVRLVNTQQTSAGFQRVVSSNNSSVVVPAEFTNDYTYPLPSLNVRWDITNTLVGRFAAYRSLTRPLLTDIQPSRRIPNFEGGNGTAGNPELDPFTATNIDVGLEWYFGKQALISAAYFRKDLNGLIERITEQVEVTDPISGRTFNAFISRPVQGDGAKVDGFEVGLQTPFTFLPGPLRSTGMLLNGTFTDSTANFSNVADIRRSSLPGLSKRSYNAILYYDDSKLSSRLAYNWRGDYLLQVSGSGGEAVSRAPYGQLDFGASYRFDNNFSVRFSAINLTDARVRSFTGFDRAKVKSVLETGRKFLMGVTFRY